LGALLRPVQEMMLVGQVMDSREAVRMAERKRPDLVLFDLSREGASGLPAIEEIKRRFSDTKCVVLNIQDSRDLVQGAFRVGADGYCLEESGFEELLEVLRWVLAGKRHFCSGISRRILSDLRLGKGTRNEVLTHREKEILRLLGERYKNKEIARSLSISSKTVGKHKSNIMKKLGCRNGVQLVSYAMQNALTEEKPPAPQIRA